MHVFFAKNAHNVFEPPLEDIFGAGLESISLQKPLHAHRLEDIFAALLQEASFSFILFAICSSLSLPPPTIFFALLFQNNLTPEFSTSKRE